MRRHISLLLGTLFVLFGAIVFPVLYLIWMIQRPEVPRSVDPGLLYALAVPGVVIELEKDAGVRDLDGTVLELDRQDLTRVLTGSFTEQDVLRKTHEVLRSIGNLSQAPPDTFQFWIQLKAERPVVTVQLLDRFRHKLAARPECNLGKALGLAWMGVQRLFGKRMSDAEQLSRVPHCRPAEKVQKAILNSVAARLHRNEVEDPDSILARPNFSPKAHRFVRRTLAIGQNAGLALSVFPLLLGGIFLLSWENRRNCYARVSAPLLITALFLLLVMIPVYVFSRDLDLYEATMKLRPMELSEGTSQWLRVTFYLVKGSMRQASYNLALIGAVLLLVGLIVARLHERCKLTALHGRDKVHAPALMSSVEETGNAASRAVLRGFDRSQPEGEHQG